MVSPRILSREEQSRLTRRQVEVLQQIVAGRTNTEAARELGIAVSTLNQRLIDIGHRLQRFTSAAKVDAALSTGQLPCPAAPAAVPDLSADELALLRAVARLSDRDHIAAQAGLAVADLPTQVAALVSKVGAINAAHLVGFAHAWNLPGFHAPSAPTPAVPEAQGAAR